LLFGLGVPVIRAVLWLGYRGGWAGADGDQFWSLGNLLYQLRSKAFVLEFMAATGVYFIACVAGVYLMRCDPRPMLRSAGVKV
jgi:hypothetical protein